MFATHHLAMLRYEAMHTMSIHDVDTEHVSYKFLDVGCGRKCFFFDNYFSRASNSRSTKGVRIQTNSICTTSNITRGGVFTTSPHDYETHRLLKEGGTYTNELPQFVQRKANRRPTAKRVVAKKHHRWTINSNIETNRSDQITPSHHGRERDMQRSVTVDALLPWGPCPCRTCR